MWSIQPFTGVGPLKFGMNRAQIASLLDKEFPLEYSNTNDDKTITEYRGLAAPFCNYSRDALSAVTFRPESGTLIYQNIDLFRSDSFSVVKSLSIVNGNVLMFSGSLLFKKIGLLLSSYFDDKSGAYLPQSENEQDDRTVSAFATGTMDSVISHFEDFKI